MAAVERAGPDLNSNDQAAIQESLAKARYVLTATETPEGVLVRPYSEDDEQAGELRIDVYADPIDGGTGFAQNVANTLLSFQMSERTPGVVWAADTTHTTRSPAYAQLINYCKTLGVKLNAFHHFHLDNYIYDPRDYPNGSNEYDFVKLLKRVIITPANVPDLKFHAIRALCSFEEAKRVADAYEALFSTLKPQVGVFGLGPEPEVHIGYIPQVFSIEQGYQAVRLSNATIERNQNRGEDVPDIAITIGPYDIRRLSKKFVSAFGNEYAERVGVLFREKEPTAKVVASILRRPDFRYGTVLSLDVASAKSLLSRL